MGGILEKSSSHDWRSPEVGFRRRRVAGSLLLEHRRSVCRGEERERRLKLEAAVRLCKILDTT